ncbi:unnamed protein product, partial [Citrullus colocynthis]
LKVHSVEYQYGYDCPLQESCSNEGDIANQHSAMAFSHCLVKFSGPLSLDNFESIVEKKL